MVVRRNSKGCRSVLVLHNDSESEDYPSDSEPWLDEPLRCAVCGQQEIARDMDKTWIDRLIGKRLGFCSGCGGSRESDIHEGLMYCAEARKNMKTMKTMKAKNAPKKNTKAMKTTRRSAK